MAATARSGDKVSVFRIGRIHRQAPAGRGQRCRRFSCRLTGKRARLLTLVKLTVNCLTLQVLIQLFHLVAKHQTVNGFVRGQDGIAVIEGCRFNDGSSILLARHPPDAQRVA